MFEIDGRDLAKRRARCSQSIEQIKRGRMDAQTSCNACGSKQSVTLANSDRYGLPVRTVMCLDCGLIYLADRLTADGYAEFYLGGAYRDLTSSFIGVHPSIDAIKQDQVTYAGRVVDALRGQVAHREGGTLLDVGGSAGAIAQRVSERFGLEPTVLDPAAEEIAAARAAGLNGIVGSLETFETDQKYDLILLCRSIEHLFDLRCSLFKMRELLVDNGLLYCDIIDFVECCRLRGAAETVTKIDHCYWLCQETAPRIFRLLGLRVVSAAASPDSECLGYLLTRCEPASTTESNEFALHQIVRKLRQIDSDWRRQSNQWHGSINNVRRAAYRVKRSVYRLLKG